VDYIAAHIAIEPFSQDTAEIIIAEIADLGYDSFIVEDEMVNAFIPKDSFNEQNLKTVLSGVFTDGARLDYTLELIKEQNWNAVWESDFEPVVVRDTVTVKAKYHKDLPKTRYNIVIDPGMSFGSGHHQTTCMMIESLLDMTEISAAKGTSDRELRVEGNDCVDDGYAIRKDSNLCDGYSINGGSGLSNECSSAVRDGLLPDGNAAMAQMRLQDKMSIRGKNLLDMGCGTGILSIVAAKLGAANPVRAIDIDPVCVRSSIANARRNHVAHKIITICGDASSIPASTFDIVLANINRNILLEDMSTYVCSLRRGGVIVMSGFYTEDIPMLVERGSSLGLALVSSMERDNWACIKMQLAE